MDIDLSRLQLPELVVMAIVGVLLLFLGYRIKKVAFFIIWFILGYSLIDAIMPNINEWVPAIAENNLWQILLPIAGGLLLALLGFTIEKLCVGGIVFGLSIMVTVEYFGTAVPTIAIGAVVGVILGALAVTLMKPAIILATAIAGSYAMTLALLAWFPEISREIFYFPMLGGFAAIGAVTQFMTTKHL